MFFDVLLYSFVYFAIFINVVRVVYVLRVLFWLSLRSRLSFVVFFGLDFQVVFELCDVIFMFWSWCSSCYGV